jgi:hypothetical protein
MSDQDPFATPADDPFAEAAAKVDEQPVEAADIEPDVSDPADEIGAEADAEIPVVNKEGETVEAPQATDQAMSPEQAEDAPDAVGAPDAAQAPTEAPQEAQETPQEPVEAPQEAEAPAAPAETAAAAPEAANGKSPVRHYKVLYQTGPSTWEEADLLKAKSDGNANIVMVDGQPWLAARNNEHATRLSFGVLGRPTQGVTSFPVPKGAWKPRRVKPAPPKPDRERLDIS